MSFSPHLSVKLYEFTDKVKAVFGGFWAKLAEKTKDLRFRVRLIVDRLADKFPPGRPRVIAIAVAGVLAVLLVVMVGTALSSKTKPQKGETTAAKGSATASAILPGIIPPEEVFLPDEPDFVPGVILEREQRAEWTAGDAEPLWQDPLKNGEEPWRNRLEKAVDDILESVP